MNAPYDSAPRPVFLKDGMFHFVDTYGQIQVLDIDSRQKFTCVSLIGTAAIIDATTVSQNYTEIQVLQTRVAQLESVLTSLKEALTAKPPSPELVRKLDELLTQKI